MSKLLEDLGRACLSVTNLDEVLLYARGKMIDEIIVDRRDYNVILDVVTYLPTCPYNIIESGIIGRVYGIKITEEL